MTQRATSLIVSFFPFFVMACQPESMLSEGPNHPHDGLDSNGVTIVSSQSTGVLNGSPTWAAVHPSNSIGLDVEDTFPGPVTSLECATQAFHYDFDGMPESVRVQLKRSGDQIDFAYQYTNVHSSMSSPATSGPSDVVGIAVGEWDEDSIHVSIGGTDTTGLGDFEMGLTRDHRVTGDVYTGYGSLGRSFGIEMSCWDADLEPDFIYDGETGTCINADGEIGMNPWPIHMVRERLDGECVSLSSTMINEEDYSHADLVGWNLRGAIFSGSTLHFANLIDAELEGADLSELEYGYADITGTTDQHTRLPLSGCSLDDSGDLFCHQ